MKKLKNQLPKAVQRFCDSAIPRFRKKKVRIIKI